MKPDQTTQSGLELLRKNNKTSHRLRELLQADPQRFDKFSLEFSDILFDFSRVAIDAAALEQLVELADAAGLERKRERMFKGEVLNITEHRAVLHHLWRSRTFSDHLSLAESDACQASILRMQELAATLHSGVLPGNPDAKVKDIIHIGIGGSLIGPKLLCEAMPQ